MRILKPDQYNRIGENLKNTRTIKKYNLVFVVGTICNIIYANGNNEIWIEPICDLNGNKYN